MKLIRYVVLLLLLTQIISCNNSEPKTIKLKITPDSSVENGMNELESKIQVINNKIFSDVEIQMIRKKGYFIVQLPRNFTQIERYKNTVSPKEDHNIYFSLDSITSRNFPISKNIISVNMHEYSLKIKLDSVGRKKVYELTKNNPKKDLNFIFRNKVFLNVKHSEYTLNDYLNINCDYLPLHEVQNTVYTLRIRQLMHSEIEEIK